MKKQKTIRTDLMETLADLARNGLGDEITFTYDEDAPVQLQSKAGLNSVLSSGRFIKIDGFEIARDNLSYIGDVWIATANDEAHYRTRIQYTPATKTFKTIGFLPGSSDPSELGG